MTNSKNLQKYVIRIVHAIRLNVNANVNIFETMYFVSLRLTLQISFVQNTCLLNI